MKRFILSILFITCIMNLYSQAEFIIEGFSEQLYAKVQIENSHLNEIMHKGTVMIFNKKDNTKLLSINCDNMALEPELLHNSSIPYDKQSAIIFQDFNFDAQNDLAIQQDFSSKGPVYSIYIYSKNSFVMDDDFTSIIQKSQGNYDLDPDAKTIQINSSGGCCWHSFSTYDVRDGKPYPSREIIIESLLPFETTTTKEWINGKMTETIEKTLNLDQEGITLIMSFELMNKNKKVVLYNINNRTLNYALVDDKNLVEFSYPTESVYKNPDFIWFNAKNELSFQNKDAEYKIYLIESNNTLESVGIKVKIKGKEYDIKGDIRTLVGNLKKIPGLDNVVKK